MGVLISSCTISGKICMKVRTIVASGGTVWEGQKWENSDYITFYKKMRRK